MDSALTERQITVNYGILMLGQAQGHFVLSDPPRMIAATFVAMEDGYQMEMLAGRRGRSEVLTAQHSYATPIPAHKEFLAFPGVTVMPSTTKRFDYSRPGTARSWCSHGHPSSSAHPDMQGIWSKS